MKAVEINNLTVKFGSFTAVDNLSLSVDRGEIFGFLGANGAGKTTAIRVMCGLLLPTTGDVRISGLTFDSGRDAIKRKVGYMSQKFTLYDDLTINENLYFKASLRKIPDNTVKEKIKTILGLIGFDYDINTLVKDIPSGIKQQMSLAATLLHDPEIVFLDEPTAGVSPAVSARFWAIIRSIAGQGKTVFVTTHYMDEAEECGRIALMRTGKLIALGSPKQLKESSYPEGLVEISSAQKGKFDLGSILKGTAVINIWPFGLKFHAELNKGIALPVLSSALPEGVSARMIKPSLEDVFMKLVTSETD